MSDCKHKDIDPRPIAEIRAEMNLKREAEEAGDMMHALARTRDRARNASRAAAFLAQHMRSGGVDTVQTNMGWWTADTAGIERILDLMSEALTLGEEADTRELDRLERLLSSRLALPPEPVKPDAE